MRSCINVSGLISLVRPISPSAKAGKNTIRIVCSRRVYLGHSQELFDHRIGKRRGSMARQRGAPCSGRGPGLDARVSGTGLSLSPAALGYFSVTLNSLITAKNSLFVEIFSLLICVGNCAKSDCGAAVFCSKTFSRCLKIAKFPVKFPDSREIAWRRARSALRRQPASPTPGDFTLCNLRNARQWRAFANWLSVSGLPNWPLRERNRR
jgi:hypothetical protein